MNQNHKKTDNSSGLLEKPKDSRTPFLENESYEQRNQRIENQILQLIETVKHDLGIPNLSEREVSSYTTRRKFLLFHERSPVYFPLITSFSNKCFDYLISQGYPSEQVQVTVYGPPGQKIDRASNAVRQLMGSAGRSVLTEYVMTGEVHIGDEDELKNELFKKTIKILDEQKEKLVKTLESKEAHDRRHQEMVNKITFRSELG